MLLNLILISGALSSVYCSHELFNVTIDTKSVLHTTSDRFLGVTIDASLMPRHWTRVDFSNQRFIEATKALVPLSMRVGGNAEDFLYFNDSTSGRGIHEETPHPFVMSAMDWDKLNNFIRNVNDCELYFGLNVLIRKGKNWDPSNAIKLLQYTNKMGYDVNFELGNEPRAFRHLANFTLDPEQDARDFLNLRKILNGYPNLRKSKLAGPDTMKGPQSIDFLRRFVKVASPVLDTVTWHQYYANGAGATVNTYMDPDILDSLRTLINDVNNAILGVWPTSKTWLGESGSTLSGGTAGLSDRYAAGFMWLDKLGSIAMLGQAAVLRQALIGGNLALLNNDYSPRPDFWLSWVFKNLVGKFVLKATIAPATNKVRLYAHCIQSERTDYPSNTVVMYGMNLLDKDVKVVLPSSLNEKGAYVYWLTPGDKDGLKSSFVKLNGQMLQTPKGEWPSLPTSKVFIPAGKPLTLQAKSFGFFTLLSSTKNACNNNSIYI